MIKSSGGKFYIYSKSGKKIGGPYKTKKGASRRLQQIEYFKHKGKPK